MTAATRPVLVLTAAALLAVGCGGNSRSSAGTTATDLTASSTQATATSLNTGIRAAIRANVQLSTYVLWHNKVPAWATRSTRGPALKALRVAAATRRRQGIRIKNLSGHYTIVSISFAPSYTTATAVVSSHQRVAPYRGSHRLGKAIVNSGRARLRLHRIGETRRFVVWSVSAIR